MAEQVKADDKSKDKEQPKQESGEQSSETGKKEEAKVDENVPKEEAKVDENVPPLIRRQSSVHRHRAALGVTLDDYFLKNLQVTQDEEIKKQMNSMMENLDVSKTKELRQNALTKFAEILRADGTLEKLFVDADENKDNNLSQEELKNLVKAYLESNKKWAPILVRKQNELAKELAKKAVIAQLADANIDGTDDIVQETVAMTVKMLDSMLNAQIKAAETIAIAMVDDLDQFTKELFEMLDVDENGKVDRQEFLNGFCGSIATVFAPERLVKYSFMAMGVMLEDDKFQNALKLDDEDDDEGCVIM